MNACASLLINALNNRSNNYHDFAVELNLGYTLRDLL